MSVWMSSIFFSYRYSYSFWLILTNVGTDDACANTKKNYGKDFHSFALKFLANFSNFEFGLTLSMLNNLVNSDAKLLSQMMCQTFGSKMMGSHSPHIYNMFLKTFLIHTFTQHVRHVNKRMVNKGIHQLGVTPGGRKLYHWIPEVWFPISVP